MARSTRPIARCCTRPIDDLLFEPLRLSRIQGGADIYPFIRNVTSSDVQPVEYYFRPPGTTGQDVLFERRTLRNFAGTGATIDNEAHERHAAFYFQDRWKPTSSISIKAGLRIETNSIYTKDREAVLGPRLPSTSDQHGGP